MATITLISATGRLKSKIQLRYTMTAPLGEILSASGLAYGTTNQSGTATIISTSADVPDFGYNILQNRIFANIPDGTWFVWAWADTSAGRFFSASKQVRVFSSGYELSDEGSAVVNPMQISNGTEGVERALFSDSSGLATWKPTGEMFAYGHYIGELYGGGVVVDVWKEGDEEKVLIASVEDIKSTDGKYDPAGDLYSTWANNAGTPPGNNYVLIGTESSSMYNGARNTNAIVAIAGTAGSAALVCSQYRGGGYEDWYLPSYYELLTIKNNESIISKALKTDSIIPWDNYWSSTELKFDSAAAMSSPGDNQNMISLRKILGARVRAVRRESYNTGDGLILSLDATNSKSFSDTSYYLSGTSSRWSCLVNRGMTSSYSFRLSAAGSSSGGTLTQLLTLFTTTGTTTDIFSGTVDSWTLAFISSATPTTPKLYNRTGESSFVSGYFSVPYGDANIKFDAGDYSYAQGTGVKLNIYVSVANPGYTSAYTLLRQVSITTPINAISNYIVPLYQYVGKTISIKITSPGSYWNSATSFAGPSIDNIYVQGTNGGFQNLGPRYFPDQGGYLKFASSTAQTTGSYIDFIAPVGSSKTVTVEVWSRLASNYSGTMMFGWGQYDVYLASGHLGFNTNSSDVYGISSTQVASLGIVGNWAHYVFEMRSDVSYTNNKIYINGELQSLSAILPGAGEGVAVRNFNGGLGRIGGFRAANNYFFNGDISVFRVYNRALTKDEILKNYSFGRKRYEIRPTILRDGIYSYIDFNNAQSYSGNGSVSGSIADLGPLGRAASLVITPTTSTPAVSKTNARLVLGVGALFFPGTTALNPYITWAESIPLNNTESVSISFWIRFSESRTAEIITKWNSTSNVVGPWEVFQSVGNSGSTITFRIRGTSDTFTVAGTKNIPNSKWTHVCATYDNSNKRMKTYIDSTIDVDYQVPNAFNIATGVAGDVFVGQYPPTVATNRYPLRGEISSMQIYTRTLSKEEVKNNYEADKFEFDSLSDTSLFFSHELTGNPTFSIAQNLTLDIAGKSNDRILASDAKGNAIWRDKSSLFNRPSNYRYIGELYGGGIIVGMWKYPSTTWNYLIMSLTDINGPNGSVWSNVLTPTYTGTEYRGGALYENKGAVNSAAIIAQSGHISSAAKLCDDYAGGGFTDWYLPSIQELMMGHNAGGSLGYVLGEDNFAYRGYNSLNGIYWSSTETAFEGNSVAYSLNTINNSLYGAVETGGPVNNSLKSATYSVRAFRQAIVNERRPIWDTQWEWDYVPIESPWIDNWSPWVESNWTPNSVTIGSSPQYSMERPYTSAPWTYTTLNNGFITFTFSSTFVTSESVIGAGVCWSTSSVSPTILDGNSPASSISSGSFVAKTPNIAFPIGWNLQLNTPIVFCRAYITTSSGTYYSSNSVNKYYFNSVTVDTNAYATYSASGNSTPYPGNVFVGRLGNSSLYE